jgi:hypothetical protein
MDFRGPDIGDFVYHCHILGHEDNGMMAIIRVKSNDDARANGAPGQPQASKAAATAAAAKLPPGDLPAKAHQPHQE